MGELTMVQYLEKSDVLATKQTEAPAFYSADGYGRKIPTRHMVRLQDKRWRRVYVCQISNAGTAYVLVKGDWRVISDYSDVAEMLRAN
jgi:hypothetical protein